MKAISLLTTMQNGAKRIPIGLIAAAGIFFQHNATALPVMVCLGSDSDFAVLAGSGITIAGAINSTTITGDIGTFPTTSITGLGNVVLNGVNHAGDAVTQNAKDDLVTAYNDAAGRATDKIFVDGFDLAGQTLFSGVYSDASSLFLSGTLTLNAQDNPDAVWVFQAGSTLITASNSTVALINGAQACHVFWQVGSSATLGTGTDFVGNILALSSITLNTGATVDGRVLAQNGAVTLDANTITRSVCSTGGSGGTGGATVPDRGSTLLLLVSGLATLFLFERRFFSGSTA